jgi:hypothetical protein
VSREGVCATCDFLSTTGFTPCQCAHRPSLCIHRVVPSTLCHCEDVPDDVIDVSEPRNNEDQLKGQS